MTKLKIKDKKTIALIISVVFALLLVLSAVITTVVVLLPDKIIDNGGGDGGGDGGDGGDGGEKHITASEFVLPFEEKLSIAKIQLHNVKASEQAVLENQLAFEFASQSLEVLMFGDQSLYVFEFKTIKSAEDFTAENSNSKSYFNIVVHYVSKDYQTIFDDKIYSNEEYVYLIDKSEVMIIKYIGSESAVIIPDTINDMQVVKIGYGSFKGLSHITSVEINDNLKHIGEQAFSMCDKLIRVTGAKNSSVVEIDDYAFFYCTSLEYIAVMKEVLVIGESAFENCSALKSYKIGEMLTSIGNNAFKQTRALTIEVESLNKTIRNENGLLIVNDRVVHAMHTTTTSIVNIASDIKYIASGAFFNNLKITEVNMTNSKVEVIGKNAFAGCKNMTKISFSSVLKEIHAKAFVNCIKIKGFELPISLNTIGANAFSYCSELTQLVIPKGVTSIGSGALKGNSRLEKVVLKCDLKPSFGEEVFEKKTKIYVEHNIEEYKSDYMLRYFFDNIIQYVGQ